MLTLHNKMIKSKMPPCLFRNITIKTQGGGLAFDSKGKCGVQIVQTGYDRKQSESVENYASRSKMELYKNLHTDLQDQKLLIARITQTSIKRTHRKSAELLEPGHILSFIGQFKNGVLDIDPDSVVSKKAIPSQPTGLETKKAHFETLEEIQFVSRTSREFCESIGSNEFYIFVSPNPLNITLAEIMANTKKMKEEKRDYHLLKSACSQAFLEKIGVLQVMEYHGLPTGNRFPQTAFLQGIQEIIHDKKLKDETNIIFDKAGFSRDAFDAYDNSRVNTQELSGSNQGLGVSKR